MFEIGFGLGSHIQKIPKINDLLDWRVGKLRTLFVFEIGFGFGSHIQKIPKINDIID